MYNEKSGIDAGRATKSTPAFVGSPTTANCRLPSTGPTSAVNGPDVCRQRARQTKLQKVARRLPSTGQTSAVNGPDRQNSQR
jgi:hypothetical protein